MRGQGLGWQTPSPEPDDYIKSLTHSLPRPSWSGTKGFVKDLFRDPMRLTQKYGIGYAPLDVVRDVASVIPGEGKAVAYGIDSMADAGASMLRSGLKDVPARIERSIGQTLDAVPDAARAAWDYLKSAGETSHDVAGYAGGGRISEFIKNLRSTMGASQAKRAEKAADLTDLSRLSDQGLLDLFHPANPSPILAMKPGDFQKFANPLPEDYKQEVPYGRFQNRSAYTARQKQRPLDLSHYLDLMGTHLQKRGADEPPLLWTYKNGDDFTQIEGHQGRHRMMAMSKLGDPLSLVKTLPAREGEGFMMDPDERVQYLMDKYFPLGSMTPVTPEAGGRPRAIGAEPFAGGGSVFKELAKIGEKYAQRQGSKYPVSPVPDYDVGHAKKVAEAFEAMKHDPTNPDVKRSYDALIEETMQHLGEASKLGLPISDQVRTNNVTAMHSPSSSPYNEFARGLAALNFAKRGRLDDYVRYGSGAKTMRSLPDYPQDMYDFPGHVAHDAHKMMVQKFLANENAPWSELTDAVKVPHYAAASDPRGAYLDNFVGDSHISRGLGFPDARTATTHGVIASNLSGPEYWSTLPWYKKLADKAGMKATPLQAVQWNAFGPQTGVETVGKPKAEILADLISQRASKAGISIEQATDEILRSDRYRRGGKVDDDFGLYHNMFFKHGGRVDEDFELFHAGPWEGIE